MTATFCPCCGSECVRIATGVPVLEVTNDIRFEDKSTHLRPAEARLVKALLSRYPANSTNEFLHAQVFQGTPPGAPERAFSVHMFRTNKALEDIGWTVRLRYKPGYVLERTP